MRFMLLSSFQLKPLALSTWLFTLKLQLNCVNNNYLLDAQKSHFRNSPFWLSPKCENVFRKSGAKTSWKHESNCVMQIICSILAEQLSVISFQFGRELFIDLWMGNGGKCDGRVISWFNYGWGWKRKRFSWSTVSGVKFSCEKKCLWAGMKKWNITQTCLLCWSEKKHQLKYCESSWNFCWKASCAFCCDLGYF